MISTECIILILPNQKSGTKVVDLDGRENHETEAKQMFGLTTTRVLYVTERASAFTNLRLEYSLSVTIPQ